MNLEGRLLVRRSGLQRGDITIAVGDHPCYDQIPTDRSVGICFMEQLPTFTFSILVENRFGVLFNITGLFSSRGYNIERLMVVPDSEPGLSRITMAARCGPALAEQIVKQLHKQIHVISVEVTDKEISWPTSIMKSTVTPA